MPWERRAASARSWAVTTRVELLDRLDVLLGGRVTEELIFGDISTGAQDDLQLIEKEVLVRDDLVALLKSTEA